MELLRRKLTVDVVSNGEFYIIQDIDSFKYIKFIQTKELDLIFDHTKIGIPIINLLSDGEKKGYKRSELIYLIHNLIKLNILEIVNVNYIREDSCLQNVNIIEEMYDSRFGQFISLLEMRTGNGVNLFEKIRSSKVCIIGLGGVGSSLAVLLSSIGIGEIELVDDDIVSESNLIRQLYFKESDIGITQKINAIKRFINEFSSYTKISTKPYKILNSSDASKYISVDCNVVVQTASYPLGYIDRYVSDYCVRNELPYISCHSETVGPFYIPKRSSCYRCFENYLDMDSEGLYCEFIDAHKDKEQNVFPSSPEGIALSASVLFNEILAFLCGKKNLKSENGVIKLNINSLDRVIKFDFKKDCICRRGQK